MALPLYLAMTGAEILENIQFPSGFGWMSGAASIAALPSWCPEGGMLILTDEQPFSLEDVPEIVKALTQAVQVGRFENVLLDFQRPGSPDTQALVRAAANSVSCPIGVSECYARETDCAVLLPPVPPDIPAEEYLRPWQDREVWLEAALDGLVINVTENGAKYETLLRGQPGKGEYRDESLCCHYRVEIGDSAVFTLRRTEEDLRILLNQAEKLGVTRAVGLYQELRDFPWEWG